MGNFLDPGVNAARTDSALYSSNDDTLLKKEKQTGVNEFFH